MRLLPNKSRQSYGSPAYRALGKSTVANIVEQRLHARGHHTMLLDGDNVRHGLNRDLGFTEVDRVENIRRVGEVAKLMVDSGLIVLCSFISPYQAERDMVRRLVEPGEFIEVFVDTPIEACIERDPKGLYAKARAGQLKNFTGIRCTISGARESRSAFAHARPVTRAIGRNCCTRLSGPTDRSQRLLSAVDHLRLQSMALRCRCSWTLRHAARETSGVSSPPMRAGRILDAKYCVKSLRVILRLALRACALSNEVPCNLFFRNAELCYQ